MNIHDYVTKKFKFEKSLTVKKINVHVVVIFSANAECNKGC